MASVLRGDDNFDTADTFSNDLTLLADFSSARKYNGTITLSEAYTNFDELVVLGTDATGILFNDTVNMTELMVLGTIHVIWEQGPYYGRWTLTNTTTLTFHSETGSWIYKVYGRSRK